MNLCEAFRQLDALNEDTFAVSDDGIKKLAEFEQNDDLTDEISVMDLDAETEDDFSDSYVGKVILDCAVCHSKLYKSKDEIELNEEQVLANVGEECPYCYSNEGFKIVGEVAKYSETDSEELEDNDDEVEDETKLEDNEESEEETKEIDECISTSPAKDDLTDAKTVSPTEKLDEAVATLERPMSAMAGTLSSAMTAHQEELANVYDRNSAIAFLDAIEPEVKNKGYLNQIKSKIETLPHRRVLQFLYNIILKGDGMGTKMESLTEDVNNVNVETDDSIVNVNTDDSGKVTVTTEPKTAEETPVDGAEVITPLTDEHEDELLNGPVEDEFSDVELDEFDDETFDGLGEGYLKKVYENVQSYKTTDCSMKDDKIMLEGVITFNSGAKKKTSFIFEAKDFTKSCKYRFIG